MQRELNPNYAKLSVQQQRVIDKMEREFWRVQKNFKSTKTRTLIYKNIETMVDEPNSKNGIRLWKEMRIMRADAAPMDPQQGQELFMVNEEDDPFSLFYRPNNQVEEPQTQSEQDLYERMRTASSRPTEPTETSLPRTPRTPQGQRDEEEEEVEEEGEAEEELASLLSSQLTFSPQRIPPTPQRAPQRRTPPRPTEEEEERKHNPEQEAKEGKEEKEDIRYPVFVDKPDIAQGGAEKYTIYCGRNPQNKPPNAIWGDPYPCMMKGFAMGKNAARLGR
jgi:hypothetical protein